MPGIRNAPAPSITCAPRPARARAVAGLDDARDLVALHQHVAGERRLAAAVEDAHVGEQHIGHRQLLAFAARNSRSSRWHSSGVRPASSGRSAAARRTRCCARAALGHRAHGLRRRDAVLVAGHQQHRRLDALDRRGLRPASASQLRA
jgi:hypothetical protein